MAWWSKMIFLIDYDRRRGKVVSLKTFEDHQRVEAQSTRLRLELDLNRGGLPRDVVLLEASSEDDLRRTHRRYFEPMRQLLKPPPDQR
jgi:hypothetical protein